MTYYSCLWQTLQFLMITITFLGNLSISQWTGSTHSACSRCWYVHALNSFKAMGVCTSIMIFLTKLSTESYNKELKMIIMLHSTSMINAKIVCMMKHCVPSVHWQFNMMVELLVIRPFLVQIPSLAQAQISTVGSNIATAPLESLATKTRWRCSKIDRRFNTKAYSPSSRFIRVELFGVIPSTVTVAVSSGSVTESRYVDSWPVFTLNTALPEIFGGKLPIEISHISSKYVLKELVFHLFIPISSSVLLASFSWFKVFSANCISPVTARSNRHWSLPSQAILCSSVKVNSSRKSGINELFW